MSATPTNGAPTSGDGNGNGNGHSPEKGIEVLWYVTGPDGNYPWRKDSSREMSWRYLRQVAGAVDHLGYSGALFATGAHDTWVLSSSLARETERMRFLIAVHPPLISPVLAAKMTATFDQFSNGRTILNIVSGDVNTLQANGVSLDHSERYAYTSEWVKIWRRVLNGEVVDFDGKYLKVKGGKVALPPVQKPAPPIWFGGASPEALESAAENVDTYLSWGEPPGPTRERIERIRELAAKHGRADKMRFGIRLYIITRDTDEQAWDATRDLMEHMDEGSIAAIQGMFKNTDSVGQQRMTALHGGKVPDDVHDLEVYPNMWGGLGLVRPGPGTAIVGSPETVLKTIEEYREAGIETFIVSGIPLLEEAYRVSEQILPHLPVVHDHNRAEAPVGGDASAEGLARQTWNEQTLGVLSKSS
jgi:alkanesulfonate monooxygenase